jgi:cyclase
MKQRLIPSLLLRSRLAFVSRRFNEYEYVGDPINILNILSSCCVDEVFIVDRTASLSGRIDQGFLERLRSVSDFPLSYAGGIRKTAQVDQVFRAGFDKIFLSACNLDLLRLAQYTHMKYGSQALGLSLDYSGDSKQRNVYNPYTRLLTEHSLLNYLMEIPVELFSDVLLTAVTSTGLSCGIDIDLLDSVANTRLRNPILLAGGLVHYSSSLITDLIRRNPHFSGISASTSIFLQNYIFGSALVSLKRHAF